MKVGYEANIVFQVHAATTCDSDDVIDVPLVTSSDVACCSRVDLENYIRFVSSFHPALQFTQTISDSELLWFLLTIL